MSPRVILASQSPRRQELLKHLFKSFEIVPSNADEDIDEKEPEQFVEKLSMLKAREVFDRVQDEDDMVPAVTGMKRLSYMFKNSKAAETDDLLVIGADTIVVKDKDILGKPKDEEDAFNILKSLQGGSHEVYTGVTLLHNNGEKTFHEKTIVHITEMSDEEIRAYIKTGDPMDKAGAYGIQTMFTKFVGGIEGDYNNVVGLPVARIYRELKQMEII
ncbi:septum formation protein [Eubacterium ruminantium]|nr:septum formation protein [Eubacterium ruminantium]